MLVEGALLQHSGLLLLRRRRAPLALLVDRRLLVRFPQQLMLATHSCCQCCIVHAARIKPCAQLTQQTWHTGWWWRAALLRS